MNLYLPIHLEILRLYRRSNVLFLFLCAYLLITPIARALDRTVQYADMSVSEFYTLIISATSPFSLLLMALFMVNNIGNEIKEGSLRKLLSLGLTKKQFLWGKVFQACLISLVVIAINTITFSCLALWSLNVPIHKALLSIPAASVINQLLSLFAAGLFGISFILLFRSRSIGLIFFPFWAFTELILFLLALADKLPHLISKLPAQLFWQTYNSPFIEPINLIITGIYFVLFFLVGWAGLHIREEQ